MLILYISTSSILILCLAGPLVSQWKLSCVHWRTIELAKDLLLLNSILGYCFELLESRKYKVQN